MATQDITVSLFLGINARLSGQALRLERTTEFKQEVINLFTFGIPDSIPVTGLGPNTDEEALIAKELSKLPGLVSNNLTPVMEDLDECYRIPGTDIWIKDRVFHLYGLHTGKNLTIQPAVDRFASGRSEDPAVLQELRQVPITLLARWQTSI